MMFKNNAIPAYIKYVNVCKKINTYSGQRVSKLTSLDT